MKHDEPLTARHNGLRFPFGAVPSKEDEAEIARRYNEYPRLLREIKSLRKKVGVTL